MDAPRLYVQAGHDQALRVFTREAVARDSVLLPFHRCSPVQRDLRSLPMNHGEFLRSAGDLHCLLQHRCVPSTFVNWKDLTLRALRDLREGDELTLNYQTIYEVVACPFDCTCGDRECYGEVRGFRHLTFDQKLKLELYLSPYLKRLLNDEVMAFRAAAS